MKEAEKKMPLVSVIIPVYNAEQTICETLDSVFSQSYQALQVIVVDDASTDSSVEKIKSYQDPRMELIRLPENGQLVAARNAGLKRVKGDYVAFLDSDDVWHSTKIEKQVAFLESEPQFGACFTWGEIIDENSRIQSLDNPEIRWFHSIFHQDNRSHKEWLMCLLTGGNYFLGSSSMLRADIVRKVGQQHLSLLQLQDYEYWVRVLSRSNVHIICEELTKYRRVPNGNSLSMLSDTSCRRSLNEGIYVCSRFFDYISDGLFVSLFQEEFRNPDSRTETELACEKAFLLEKAFCGKEPYLAALERLLNHEASAKVLAEKFQYTQKDFYLQNGHLRYADQKEHQYLLDELGRLQKEVEEYSRQMDGVLHSRSWRITKPIRSTAEAIRRNRHNRLNATDLKSLLFNVIPAKWKRLKWRLNYRCTTWKLTYSKSKLFAQKAVIFPKRIKFSIIVPLYNTPEQFLREMIQSVLDQTYSNWELCLADGSDAQHGTVETVCREYAQQDSRILYRKLEKNLGISGNSNACLEMATGKYIALLDHDDLLHPAALFEMMVAICRKSADFIYTDESSFYHSPEDADTPQHKPDYAPDTLRSYNYICHFTAFDKKLLEKAGGGFRSEFDGAQDYDLILRLTEQAKKIVHIPRILYYWRKHPGSVASDISAKPYALDAAKRALTEHLECVGLKGAVQDSKIPTTYKIQYAIEGNPLVSILIPTKDHIDDLKKCIESVQNKTTYPNWEIIVIENNSTEQETFAYYQEIQKDDRIRVIVWDGEFNYSAINNYGEQYANGTFILLLNNDTEVINPDWLEQMLMYAQRDDVGAVGAMLYYPDDTVQHAGVIVGLWGGAGHSHKNYVKDSAGYMGRMTLAQNYSAVTAACLLMRRAVWKEINGMDEAFKVAFNDVDMCLRIRKAGYLIVWTPYAELYHYESKSRGADDTPEKKKRAMSETLLLRKRWAGAFAAGDPYYNPNLTLEKEDFSLR